MRVAVWYGLDGGKSVEWKMGSWDWYRVWRACIIAVIIIYWGMGGIHDDVGFVERKVFIHWVGVSMVAVVDVAGGRMLGLVRRARSGD